MVDDCHQVLVSLQLSFQVPVALVASPVKPLSPDPVSSWVDSIPAFDQMITVVEPPSLSDLSSRLFVIFLRLKYQSNAGELLFPRIEP
jgi:hypothetical protein